VRRKNAREKLKIAEGRKCSKERLPVECSG
jgi:hypothetical protein